MSVKWEFPSNDYGILNGIGEAGIETFKGLLYRSLAREICQNSLDAALVQSQPVRVEFMRSFLSDKDIPDFDALINLMVSRKKQRRKNNLWQDI